MFGAVVGNLVGDVVEIARNILSGVGERLPAGSFQDKEVKSIPLKDISEIESLGSKFWNARLNGSVFYVLCFVMMMVAKFAKQTRKHLHELIKLSNQLVIKNKW